MLVNKVVKNPRTFDVKSSRLMKKSPLDFALALSFGMFIDLSLCLLGVHSTKT